MGAISELTCADLAAAYRRGRLSPVDVARDCFAPHRAPRRDQRLCRRGFGRRLEGRGRVASALARGQSTRANRRRTGLDQGQYLGQGPTHPARLKNQRNHAGASRFAGGRAPARAGCGRPRQDLHCPSTAGLASATRRSPAAPTIRGMPSTPQAARPAAARWPCCLVWACCISAPTAPVRCVSRPLLPGVFGIKPSFGRVPVYPALMLNVLSHQGPITRTVADAATMLSVIAQPNGRDIAAWITPAPDFSAGLNDGVRGLRVAFSARLGQDFALDPEIEAASRKAARVLEQAMQMPPPPGLGG
jgi:aspartyl-tRNA(Asn)/glutamyl-tRNA(Gln) amidotransferase subunit A